MLIRILRWRLADARAHLGRHQRGSARWGMAGSLLLLLSLALAACTSNTPAPPPAGTALNQLHQCDTKTTTFFQDDSQTPPATLTDWKTVKNDLTFTTYLPARLPNGTCLVNGHAIVHDKVLGSQFSVSYILPGGVPLAISETFLNGAAVPALQCLPDASNKGSLECLGSKGQTSVVFDSSDTEKNLQALFKSLQPNVDWVPKQ